MVGGKVWVVDKQTTGKIKIFYENIPESQPRS